MLYPWRRRPDVVMVMVAVSVSMLLFVIFSPYMEDASGPTYGSKNICLDSAFSFVTSYVSDTHCYYFDRHEAENLLLKGSSTCHTKCQIKLTSSNVTANSLASVSMVFDSYNYSRRTGCLRSYRAHLTIHCSHLGKGQLGIFWNSDCKERNAECSKWRQLCVCHCDPEYSMTNGHCIQTYPNGDLASTQTENNESPNIGSIFGALFGGLLLGLIIATVIGFVMYRKFPSHFQNCADPRLMFAKKKTHNRDRDKDNIQQDKQRQVLNVSPLTRSERSPEYSNTSGQQNTVTVTDDVYNYLNEEEETRDGDTYDHACAATKNGHAMIMSDYSNHHGLNDDYNSSAGRGTDDYFTLEHI